MNSSPPNTPTGTPPSDAVASNEGASHDFPPECHYAVIMECVGIARQPDHEGEIYFAPVPGRTPPLEKTELCNDIEMTSKVLQQLFPDRTHSSFRMYFDSLLATARLGLLCDKANPAAGKSALDTLKQKIVISEGRRIKSQHLRKLGVAVLVAMICFAGIGLAIEFVPRIFPQLLPSPNQAQSTPGAVSPSNYAFMLAAAMPAIWLSFASRTQRLRFEELNEPNEDLMEPIYRIAYVSGFTGVLALLCGLNAAGVSIGNFATANLGSSLATAVLFGALCGLSEQLLATTVAPFASRLLESMRHPRPATSGGSP